MQRLTWQILSGSRRSSHEKFFITFLALDVSRGNSILVEHFNGVNSLREWSIWQKNTFYKTVEKTKLEWKELEELLTEVDTKLINRPLTYIEEDIQFPVLTPKLLVSGQVRVIPNDDHIAIENKERERQKYIQRCKEKACKR